MRPAQTARRVNNQPGASALLEGYFHVGWDGHPMPDYAQRTRDGALYDVYVCRECAAITPQPHSHAAWHLKASRKEGTE